MASMPRTAAASVPDVEEVALYELDARLAERRRPFPVGH